MQQQQQQQPQLLVCHDMMGGYLPVEVSLSGAAGCGQYRLWHWDCMDVFCYFSHHMVSIPPKGWIHAAHKHGVKVRPAAAASAYSFQQ
jgi:mannosyl-glycoprotein endo-beta-N-acetylglucosaminidase